MKTKCEAMFNLMSGDPRTDVLVEILILSEKLYTSRKALILHLLVQWVGRSDPLEIDIELFICVFQRKATFPSCHTEPFYIYLAGAT